MSFLVQKCTNQLLQCIGIRGFYSVTRVQSPLSLLFNVTLPANSQYRGLKDDLKERGIEWREPKKLPCYHPSKTGDLEAFDEPDKSRPVLGMRLAMEEYDAASPKVQQLLSLEFATRNSTQRLAKYDALRQVQRHQYDTGSKQAQIAALTIGIRFYQDKSNEYLLIKYPEYRVKLKHKCDLRKKLLSKLRREDYKLFEWLLEKLNIMYKPYPINPGKIYREDSLRKLVSMRCDNLRESRLAAYKEKLEGQKEAFEAEKKNKLQWIKETQEKFGLEVTVDPETGMIEPPEPQVKYFYERVYGPFQSM